MPAEIRRNHARSQRIRGGVRALEPPGQLECKQHVGELGLTVRPPRVVAAFPGQVVELDADLRCRANRRAAADDDDPALRRRDDLRQQLIDEDEVPEMVDDELFLDAVDLLEFGQLHHARIADQHVDRVRSRPHVLGCRDDRREIRQLDDDRRGPPLDAVASIDRLLPRPPRAEHVRAAQRQHSHRLVTDTRVAAGHQRGQARQVDAGGDFLGGRVRPERADRDVRRKRQLVVAAATGEPRRSEGRGRGGEQSASVG